MFMCGQSAMTRWPWVGAEARSLWMWRPRSWLSCLPTSGALGLDGPFFWGVVGTVQSVWWTSHLRWFFLDLCEPILPLGQTSHGNRPRLLCLLRDAKLIRQKPIALPLNGDEAPGKVGFNRKQGSFQKVHGFEYCSILQQSLFLLRWIF